MAKDQKKILITQKRGSMNNGTRRPAGPASPLQLRGQKIAYSSSSAGLIYAKTCVVGKGERFLSFLPNLKETI